MTSCSNTISTLPYGRAMLLPGPSRFFSTFLSRAEKRSPDNPLLRELIIPFGSAGYVALFEIENDKTVTILAIRHQREDDYY